MTVWKVDAPAALCALLALLASLAVGCSRSGLWSPANRDLPSGMAGVPASSERPGVAGSDAPPDPRAQNEPPRRDGGVAPARDGAVQLSPDAGSRDAGARDAGPRDAGTMDASTPEPPSEPPPLRAPGDLVFAKQRDGTMSLWALRLSDFALRRLDPPAARRPVAGAPHSYSPDGRKLLIIEADENETRYRIAYRCREQACAGVAQPSRVVLRGPAEDVTFETYDASPYAADSSAMLLQTKRGVFYVRFAASGAADAVQLSDVPHEQAYFVAGSRGALLSHDQQGGVTFVDLEREPLTPRRLLASDGSEVATLRSLSPDGQHWLTSPPLHTFALSDVLAGKLDGTLVSPGWYAEIAGDQWFLVRGDTRLELHSWDGSKPSELAGSETLEPYGCGNRVVLVSNDKLTMSRLDLASSASADPPQLVALVGMPVGEPRFVARCSKALVRNGTRNALIDLTDGSTLERDYIADYSFNDSATLMGSRGGVYTTYRVDTLANATPMSFSPRRVLDASPMVFAHDAPFFVAAGPLFDMMQPRLYRVDFSDASQPAPKVETLTDRPSEINNLVLTADDRYLAYAVRLPRLAVDPATVGEGVYERDLLTGATELIAAPFERGLNRYLRVQPIPEHRAMLLMGNYANAARESLYVVNLDSDELVRQVPDEAEPRVPLDTGMSDDFVVSNDGKVLWYRAVGAKPSRFAQPLRFSNAAPLAPAQVLEYEPQLHAYAHARMDSAYDGALFGEVGPLFHARSGAAFGSTNERATLSYFDLQSGTARVLARGEGVNGSVFATAFAPRSGRIALMRWDDQGKGRVSFVKANAPELEEPVLSGTNLSSGRFSPDERWFVFKEAPGGAEETVHLYDVAAGEDHVLPPVASGASRIEVTFFDPAAPRVLVQTDQSKLYSFDLADGAAPKLVAEDVEYFLQISSDGQYAAWRSGEGTFVSKLDGSLQPRRLAEGDYAYILLSPSGRRVLVREPSEMRWRLFRTDALDAEPVVLADSVQANMAFDPSERYAVGSYDESGASYMTAWQLDDPSTPHPLLTNGETGWSFWVDGPAL